MYGVLLLGYTAASIDTGGPSCKQCCWHSKTKRGAMPSKVPMISLLRDMYPYSIQYNYLVDAAAPCIE